MRMTGRIAGADRIADRANRESSGDPHPQFCEQGLLLPYRGRGPSRIKIILILWDRVLNAGVAKF